MTIARSIASAVAKPIAKPVASVGASGSSTPLILDTYSALGGWGLSKRKNAATTPFRTRESGGNTEQDASFTANALNTTALQSFTGSNSGFITKAYDQSGNGRDLLQATTTLQPRIVNAGAADDGFVFDGSNDYLRNTAIAIAMRGFNVFSICFWAKKSATWGANSAAVSFSNGAMTANALIVYVGDTNGGNGMRVFSNDLGAAVINEDTASYDPTLWHHYAVVSSGSGSVAYVDGVSVGTGSQITIHANSAAFDIGAWNATQLFSGSIRDVFLFGSALSASDIAAIKTATT